MVFTFQEYLVMSAFALNLPVFLFRYSLRKVFKFYLNHSMVSIRCLCIRCRMPSLLKNIRKSGKYLSQEYLLTTSFSIDCELCLMYNYAFRFTIGEYSSSSSLVAILPLLSVYDSMTGFLFLRGITPYP